MPAEPARHGEHDEGTGRQGDEAAATSAGESMSPWRITHEAVNSHDDEVERHVDEPGADAGVPVGMANRSRNPAMAAASAPSTPRAMNQYAPLAKTSASSATREAMSNPKLATQAPMGTVTRIGWNGWPYGPASTLTGCFAWRSLSPTGSFCSAPMSRTVTSAAQFVNIC